MRGIKCRGRAEVSVEELDELGIRHENGWVYGSHIDGYIINGIVEATSEHIVVEQWCPIDKWTLGQYTGLKDKNGTGIYEGDVVSYKGRNLKKAFGIRGGDDYLLFTREIKYRNQGFNVPQGFVKELKVIGNIYENKELLA